MKHSVGRNVRNFLVGNRKKTGPRGLKIDQKTKSLSFEQGSLLEHASTDKTVKRELRQIEQLPSIFKHPKFLLAFSCKSAFLCTQMESARLLVARTNQ